MAISGKVLFCVVTGAPGSAAPVIQPTELTGRGDIRARAQFGISQLLQNLYFDYTFILGTSYVISLASSLFLNRLFVELKPKQQDFLYAFGNAYNKFSPCC